MRRINDGLERTETNNYKENQGLHGGKELGTNTPHVWDDTIANTVENGELVRAALDYLRKQGFDVEVR